MEWQVNFEPGMSLPIDVPEEGTDYWYYYSDIAFIIGSENLEGLASDETPSWLAGATMASEFKDTKAGRFDCYKAYWSTMYDGMPLTYSFWWEKATGVLVAETLEMQVSYVPELQAQVYQAQEYEIQVSLQLESTNAAIPTGGIGGDITIWIIVGVVIVIVVVGAVFALKRMKKLAITPTPPQWGANEALD